jgi:two-component system cell cycle sensor histidine kinase/response regulator CckA
MGAARAAGALVSHTAALSDDTGPVAALRTTLLVHDLRNSLAVIEAAVTGLALRPDLSAELRETLGLVARMTRRTTGLARLLLPVPPEAIPAEELDDRIRMLAPELTLAAGPVLRLDLRLAAPPGTKLADPAALDRILMNLVSNARAAADESKTGTRIELRTRAVAGGVVIEVEDDGAGMPADIAARLAPSVLLDGVPEEPSISPEGHGLGLASVATLVRSLGGFLAVETGEAKGSRFVITLDRSGVSPKLETERCRDVLLVEDDPTLRSYLALILRDEGWVPQGFASAEEAWLQVKKCGGAPAALITDLSLPGDWTGRELIRQLRRRWPSLPAILLSGYGPSEADRQPPYFAHMTKPIDAAALLGELEKLTAAT